MSFHNTLTRIAGWSQNFTEPAVEYWTNRLGNLVILNRNRNSKAQNYDFEKKKRIYFKPGANLTNFNMTVQVLKETEWTPTVVEARHRHMLNTLYDV